MVLSTGVLSISPSQLYIIRANQDFAQEKKTTDEQVAKFTSPPMWKWA